MQISLCITNYNRNAYLFKSFEQVVNDERIGEIVIVDDNSNIDLFNDVARKCEKIPKVRLVRNPINLGCYANKNRAISEAKFDYVIIFDSDNVLGVDYLDKIYSVEWSSKVALAPDYAKPVFDYRKFGGLTFNKTNVGQYAFQAGFDCLINTMNYFIHRDSFLSVYQRRDVKGADSIYLNYLWLLAGNEIHCLKGLEYIHRVEHKAEHGSNYVQYAKESEPMCKDFLNKIASMR